VEKNNNYLWFLYVGVLPFAFCLSLSYFNFHSITFLGSINHIFYSYALLISCFMSGALWGHYSNKKNNLSVLSAIVSNIIIIVSWICFLIFPNYILGYIFSASFIVLFCMDFYLCKIGQLSGKYLFHRLIVTIIVVFFIILNGAYFIR
jgi:hypothetical protein